MFNLNNYESYTNLICPKLHVSYDKQGLCRRQSALPESRNSELKPIGNPHSEMLHKEPGKCHTKPS